MYTRMPMDPPKAKAMLTRLVDPRKHDPGTTACRETCCQSNVRRTRTWKLINIQACGYVWSKSDLAVMTLYGTACSLKRPDAPLARSLLFPDAAATSPV